MTVRNCRAIRIDQRDNVATLVAEAQAGDRIEVTGVADVSHLTARQRIPFGHKVSLVDIAEGELLYKYGEPIGRATRAVRQGDHVHIHNLAGLRAREKQDRGSGLPSVS